MQDSLRPSWLLIINALVVMAFCLGLFAYFVVVLFTTGEFIARLAILWVLFIPLLIAAMQYRAVFRRNENAARHVGNYLFLAGGLLSIFFAMMTCICAANEKEINYQNLSYLCALTLASLYLLFCGKTNQRWAKELFSPEPSATDEQETQAGNDPIFHA